MSDNSLDPSYGSGFLGTHSSVHHTQLLSNQLTSLSTDHEYDCSEYTTSSSLSKKTINNILKFLGLVGLPYNYLT